MKRASPKLKKLYTHLNRKYFKNRLPKRTRVGWTNLKYAGYIGLCTYTVPPKIELTSEFKNFPRITESTLLHEMNHIWTCQKHLAEGVGHGPKFQAGMMRLAKLGALKRLW